MARRITVAGCLGCPFAHRELSISQQYYCCVLPSLPTVYPTPGREIPDFCPLLNADFFRVALAPTQRAAPNA